jgi:hypothetical protein
MAHGLVQALVLDQQAHQRLARRIVARIQEHGLLHIGQRIRHAAFL